MQSKCRADLTCGQILVSWLSGKADVLHWGRWVRYTFLRLSGQASSHSRCQELCAHTEDPAANLTPGGWLGCCSPVYPLSAQSLRQVGPLPTVKATEQNTAMQTFAVFGWGATWRGTGVHKVCPRSLVSAAWVQSLSLFAIPSKWLLPREVVLGY